MTAQDLARQFAERLRKADNELMSNALRTGPCYPMIVLTLGGATNPLNCAVQFGLRQLWPPYWREIAFLDALRTESGATFARSGVYEGDAPPAEADLPDPVPLSETELKAVVSRLFRSGGAFSRATHILLYALLDAGNVRSPDELSFWLGALDQFREILGDGVTVLPMLTVLINEDFNHGGLGDASFEALGGYLNKQERPPSVLLVSNRKNDLFLDMDGSCRRLATAVIAVSNSHDPQVVREMFASGLVMAAGYARAEKPVDDISRICIENLLEELNKFAPSNEGDLFGRDAERTRERLGISPEGTFRLLDEYVGRNLSRYVPDGEELRELLRGFPIFAPDTDLNDELCAETSSARINELTFGAWNCYLENAVRRAREGLQGNETDLQNWREHYAASLRERFHAKELAELSRHLDRIRDFARPANRASADTSIHETAGRRLKYLLSADPEIREALLDEIRKAGERASEFLGAWETLMRSLAQMPGPSEDNADNEEFIHYYRHNLRTFFDNHEAELRQRFQNIPDVRAFEEFFRDVMDRLFDNPNLRKIFAATFEDVGAMQVERTRSTLTGPHVPIYFSYAGSALEAPFLSFVLLNADDRPGALFRVLKDSLPDPESVRFYNTGRRSAAESLNIYRLDRRQLWSVGAEEDEP